MGIAAHDGARIPFSKHNPVGAAQPRSGHIKPRSTDADRLQVPRLRKNSARSNAPPIEVNGKAGPFLEAALVFSMRRDLATTRGAGSRSICAALTPGIIGEGWRMPTWWRARSGGQNRVFRECASTCRWLIWFILQCERHERLKPLRVCIHSPALSAPEPLRSRVRSFYPAPRLSPA